MSDKAQLKDILNYNPDAYLSQEDLSLIKNTFGGNPRLIKVLRKILMPVVEDPDMPIEEFSADLFLTGRDWGSIPNEEVKSLVVAREETMKFVMGGLIKLKVIANQQEDSPEEIKERRKKDSTK